MDPRTRFSSRHPAEANAKMHDTEASTSRKRIVLTGPASVLSQWDSDTLHRDLLMLPHPRNGLPAYFLPYAQATSPTSKGKEAVRDSMLELTAVQPDTSKRSWMIGPNINSFEGSQLRIGQPPDDDRVVDTVVEDGTLHMLSPIDPFFLVLPILEASFPLDSKEKLPFLTSEDLLERAARHWSRHLASQALGAPKLRPGEPKPKIEDADSWKGITDFGNTDACLKALIKTCDTQEVTANVQVYRLSKEKVLQELERKVDLLSATSEHFNAAPETLGRKYNRILESYQRISSGPLLSDEGFDDAQKRAARRKVAVEQVLAGWLSPAWVETVQAHCNVTSDAA